MSRTWLLQGPGARDWVCVCVCVCEAMLYSWDKRVNSPSLPPFSFPPALSLPVGQPPLLTLNKHVFIAHVADRARFTPPLPALQLGELGAKPWTLKCSSAGSSQVVYSSDSCISPACRPFMLSGMLTS